MNKNKTRKALALRLLLVSAGLSSIAFGADGLTETINIEGEVTGGGCTVSFPTSISFADTDISKLEISTAANSTNMITPSGQMPTLDLSDCAAEQQFTVTLLGTADADDANALANGSTNSPATHVGLLMFLGNGASAVKLTPGTPSSAYTAKTDGTFNVQAWPGLVKTTDAPGAGDVRINGQIQIVYL